MQAKFRLILIITLLVCTGRMAAQQTTAPENAVQNSNSQAQAEAAVAEARSKNRQYWKTIKLIMLGGLAAAFVLMQLQARRRRLR